MDGAEALERLGNLLSEDDERGLAFTLNSIAARLSDAARKMDDEKYLPAAEATA